MTDGDPVTAINPRTTFDPDHLDAAASPSPQLPASRLPAPPAVVADRFGDFQGSLSRYASWLADAGTIRGLIGPREVPRIWERHILNSLGLSELLPANARLVDLGSGAGLPGLAIACVRPDLRVDLVESSGRRTDFLSEVLADLGIRATVRVVHGRAEDDRVVEAVGSAAFVTARAVAPLDKLVRWAFALLRPGGALLAIKGSGAQDEIRVHRAALRRVGAQAEILDCGVGWLDPPTRVVRIVRPN